MTKYNIGIDLGGTKILACIIQKSDRKVLFEVKKKTKKDKGNEKILSKIFETLDELFEISKITKIPKWLPSDFKKKGGFKRSLEISKEYSLYRQEYCGCVYSKN